MAQTIEAIYENGIFRPLQSVDLPDKSVVQLDLLLPGNGKEQRQKVSDVFREAGLSTPLRFGLPPSSITDERRKELAEKFGGQKPLGDLIDEDREARG